MNKSISVSGDTHCFDCFDALAADEKQLQGKQVVHTLDPTICSFCEKDFGNERLQKIGKHPSCTACAENIRNKTFPLWVKGFFAFVLAAVVFSVIGNLRYFQAWNANRESNQAVDNGNIELGYEKAKEAAGLVPELPDMQDFASYYHGILLIQKDSAKAAMSEFKKAYATMGDYSQMWMKVAQLSIDFDNKDYKAATKTATDLKDMDSSGAMPWLRIASAFACQYAVSGNDSLKRQSLSNLEKGKKKVMSDKTESIYANMVEYRLENRDDRITFPEFEKKYPKGWATTN